jgi:predicted transcriptional regulator
MRTTVEMKPEHRARLLSIAARRGEKGFSGVLREAIETYLQAERRKERDLKAALAVEGSFSSTEAAKMRGAVRSIRENWR